MADNTAESQTYPVNELGEIIFAQSGSGSTTVAGFIDSTFIPVDPRTGRVKAVFGPASTETASVGNNLTYYVKEGDSVKFTSVSATGTITKYKADGSVDFTQAVASGNTFNYGPYSGTQKFVVSVSAGIVNATVSNSVLTIYSNNSTISPSCKFFLPWFRDTSGNVLNRSTLGDAAKTGSNTGAAVQVANYFRAAAGSPRANGLYYNVPAAISNVDISLSSIICHMGFKMSVGTQRQFAGSQSNSTVPGFQFIAETDGGLTVYYKMGNTQNNFTKIAGLIDGTDHQVTVFIDRVPVAANTYSASIYVDGALRETKNFTQGGTAGAQQIFALGSYATANAAYDVDFFNCHLYGPTRDLADINVLQCVDKMTISRQALTIADIG